jgi:hypothetical protein
MKIKRFLPIILLVLGLIVLVVVVLVVKNKSKKTAESTPEETVAEVALNDRPVASLTPSEDGHWLTLNVEKLLSGAKSVDYELLYYLPDGRTQGVPGNVTISGTSTLERKLLLGSESSGKYRYDEGVEKGTLTLRFRSDKGKLLGKFSTDFALLSGTDALASIDGKFEYTLNKVSKTGYFVVMNTFGVPSSIDNLEEGPYGVFSSLTIALPGKVSLGSGKISISDGSSWEEVVDNKASNIGIFVSTK